MAELCSNFGGSAITKGKIAYFSLRMRETPIFLLPVKNLTSLSWSPTPISYKMKEFSVIRPKVRAKLHIFFIAHLRNGHISTYGQKSDVTIVFSDPYFLQHKGILAIRPQVRAKLHIFFSLCMRKSAIVLPPVKNLTSPSCSLTPISYKLREFWRYVNI